MLYPKYKTSYVQLAPRLRSSDTAKSAEPLAQAGHKRCGQGTGAHLATMPALVQCQPVYWPYSWVAAMSPAGVAATRSGMSRGSGAAEEMYAL